jgi:hypothetical protein
MNCPYCAERVADAAIVCMHCHRDLYLIRPLMERLDQATKRLEALEVAAGPDAARRRAPQSVLPWLSPLSALSLMFIALVLAHFVIIVEYNWPLFILRIVSILVPLTFGFFCLEVLNRTLLFEFGYGLMVAAASVLCMAAVIGRLDNVPVLPRTAYEWREFIEYGLSIAFGFFTGVIIRQTVIATRSKVEMRSRLITVASRALANRKGRVAQVALQKFGPFVRTAAALASGAISVTTGFKYFF